LIFFIIALSLFDSFSTTSQIIIFALLLTTVNPLRNALSYLGGLAGAYFLCGLAGLKVLDALIAISGMFLPSSANIPDSLYYQTQILAGAVFIVIGIVYYIKKKNSDKPPVENMIILRLKNMNVYVAFGLGAFISVTSFPMALPYIAVLGKIAAMKPDFATSAFYILLYNFGYAFPLVVILFVYLFMRHRADDFNDTLHAKVRMLNLRLTAGIFVFIGMLTLADAAYFFITGHPFVKGRYY
jgi:cytochrome c biogenesis protein CcdA